MINDGKIRYNRLIDPNFPLKLITKFVRVHVNSYRSSHY
jgi:hypothetical protein